MKLLASVTTLTLLFVPALITNFTGSFRQPAQVTIQVNKSISKTIPHIVIEQCLIASCGSAAQTPTVKSYHSEERFPMYTALGDLQKDLTEVRSLILAQLNKNAELSLHDQWRFETTLSIAVASAMKIEKNLRKKLNEKGLKHLLKSFLKPAEVIKTFQSHRDQPMGTLLTEMLIQTDLFKAYLHKNKLNQLEQIILEKRIIPRLWAGVVNSNFFDHYVLRRVTTENFLEQREVIVQELEHYPAWLRREIEFLNFSEQKEVGSPRNPDFPPLDFTSQVIDRIYGWHWLISNPSLQMSLVSTGSKFSLKVEMPDDSLLLSNVDDLNRDWLSLSPADCADSVNRHLVTQSRLLQKKNEGIYRLFRESASGLMAELGLTEANVDWSFFDQPIKSPEDYALRLATAKKLLQVNGIYSDSVTWTERRLILMELAATPLLGVATTSHLCLSARPPSDAATQIFDRAFIYKSNLSQHQIGVHIGILAHEWGHLQSGLRAIKLSDTHSFADARKCLSEGSMLQSGPPPQFSDFRIEVEEDLADEIAFSLITKMRKELGWDWVRSPVCTLLDKTSDGNWDVNRLATQQRELHPPSVFRLARQLVQMNEIPTACDPLIQYFKSQGYRLHSCLSP